jgi:5-methylcytosine-specific restriction protein B
MENNIMTDNSWEQYRKEGRVEFITFHPAYTYEDFIEGITVHTQGENIPTENIKYKLKPGIFKDICKKALGAALNLEQQAVEDKSWKDIYEIYSASDNVTDFKNAPKYVLIIDEINRGDIAKIFGELITLLEADKRLGQENELIVTLPYSKHSFGVPPNLYIIGTMNTADRSIALLDVALRRRFGFIEMNPNFEVLRKEHIDKNRDRFEEGVAELLERSIAAIEKINRKICTDKSIGRDKQIGHSFLFKVFNKSDLILVWKHEILPLLEEYCYSDYGKINRILFNKDSNTKWIDESMGIKEIVDINEMFDEILKNE